MKDIYRVKIEKLDHYGRGIAHIGGKIVFIPYVLPEEEVDIQIEVEKKKYMEASPVQIQKYSKDRIESICPYFGKCGGCDLLHLSYEKALIFKENKVKEILERFGSVSTSLIEPIVFSDSITNYRNKASFKVKEKIGYYGKKSYELIGINACQIVHPRINEILNILKEETYLSSLKDIIIRVSSLGESMVILGVENDSSLDVSRLEKEVDTVIIRKKGIEERKSGKGYITEKIDSYIFDVSPTSFFQVNRFCVQKLYDIVYSAIDGKKQTILDLYCGTGTLGIYVSDKAEKIIGIEINEESVKNARENALKNRVSNSKFYCQNLTKIKNNSFMEESIDVVIVDPPRAGLEGDALSFLMEHKIPQVVYVSCDPMTLARDVKELQKVYTVEKVIPVDMFPGTYHVECVCVLKRH